MKRPFSHIAALAGAMNIFPPEHEEYEPHESEYEPDSLDQEYGIGDDGDYDPELEELLSDYGDDDDHLGGPGDVLLGRIEALQGKEKGFIRTVNSSSGGRRRRAVNALARVRKVLTRKRQKLAGKLARFVGNGKLSENDAAHMASRARMDWTPEASSTDLAPSGSNGTTMTRPSGSNGTTMTRPSGPTATSPQQPGAVMQNQTPLPNGATQWGGTHNEPIRSNAGAVQVFNTTELVKGPGVETPVLMLKAGTTSEWVDVTWAIGAGGRQEWKAELPLISFAAFEIVAVKIEQMVIGRASDTALFGTVDSIAPDGSNNLLIGKRSFSFDETVITTIDSLRKTGRIDPNQKATVSGYVEQLAANAAELIVKFRVSLITRVTADRG